jgi:hypothetical protein
VVCAHVKALEEALIAAGVRETFRGKAWTKKWREWVYFDCYLNRRALRERFGFDECVMDHEHLGAHDGQEAGFVCTRHHDAIMGKHPYYVRGGTREFA